VKPYNTCIVLIEMEEDKLWSQVRTQDFNFDTMLNNPLSQKIKLIKSI